MFMFSWTKHVNECSTERNIINIIIKKENDQKDDDQSQFISSKLEQKE